MGAELRDHRGTPPGLARVQADRQRTVDAGEIRLSKPRPGATRPRRAGRGSVEANTVKPLSKNPEAVQAFGPEDHVFGDEVGRRLHTTQKAWQTAVLKANGHTPRWHPRTNKLQPESQTIYQAVDLRFHDLRHEAGSRWLEAGMSIHHVKALLGHASLSTTDIYLNATRIGLHEAMQSVDAKRTTGTLQPLPPTGHHESALVN